VRALDQLREGIELEREEAEEKHVDAEGEVRRLTDRSRELAASLAEVQLGLRLGLRL